MKKYTIEELKNEEDEKEIWIEGSQENLNKLLNKAEFRPTVGNIYNDDTIFHFYLSKNSFGGWNPIDGMNQRGKTIIKFSQIDFQETPEDILKHIIIW
jgi:hypothetical protein